MCVRACGPRDSPCALDEAHARDDMIVQNATRCISAWHTSVPSGLLLPDGVGRAATTATALPRCSPLCRCRAPHVYAAACSRVQVIGRHQKLQGHRRLDRKLRWHRLIGVAQLVVKVLDHLGVQKPRQVQSTNSPTRGNGNPGWWRPQAAPQAQHRCCHCAPHRCCCTGAQCGTRAAEKRTHKKAGTRGDWGGMRQ